MWPLLDEGLFLKGMTIAIEFECVVIITSHTLQRT